MTPEQRALLGMIKAEDISEAYEILKHVRRRAAVRATQTYEEGDRVAFMARGRRVVGTVSKVNRNTVSVKADTGTTWRVTGTLLSLTKDQKPTQEEIGNALRRAYR